MEIKLTAIIGPYIQRKDRDAHGHVAWWGIVKHQNKRGALMQRQDGSYWQVAGRKHCIPLDGSDVEIAMGAARAIRDRVLDYHSVRLDGMTSDVFRRYGDDNLSEGIRKAANTLRAMGLCD